MSAELKAATRALLAGNLWIDDEQVGIRTEDAAMFIAAAQLKAVAIALAIEDVPEDSGIEGWTMETGLTRLEASAAIGGIASLLAGARTIFTDTESARSANKQSAPNEAEAAE